MRSRIRTTVAALVLGATITGCASDEPAIPVPSAGAAWGAAVVPYSDNLEMSGGWGVVSDEGTVTGEAQAALAVTTGQQVKLAVNVTNVGATNFGVYIRLRDDEDLLDRAVAAKIFRSDKTVVMDDAVLSEMRSDAGYGFGGADAGAVITISGEMEAPKVVSCDDPKFDVDLEVRTESGERRAYRISLTVENPDC